MKVEGISIRYEYDDKDPRFSRQQKDAILSCAAADGASRLLGLDDNHRPVVRASVGIPRTVRTWAIMRNGDPTEATEIVEAWSGLPQFTREPYV